VIELELTRSRGDRRLYELDGIGTLRLEGLTSRRATAAAGERRWSVARRGFWGRTIEAVGADGSVEGRYEPRAIRRGGALQWGSQAYALRPASAWRERYALADGEQELALFEGKGWGRRPVRVSLAAELDPGLVLFAAFVVRGLAEDAGAAAGAAASTAAVSG
jgi:hypothetical protein